MEIMKFEEFVERTQPWKTFYVAFLKGAKGSWFPFCILSSEDKEFLDTLCVSSNYVALEEVVKPVVDRVPSVAEYLIHFVYSEEIKNLVERYQIEFIGYLGGDKDGDGCGCGCGCR
ncbi:MAG: hypothetical protein JRI45_07420 [Deltaproteobacteria bacterium]|nr:hypothetical protein [Deltaproteobacteria bacterium]MBW2068720.1 hypothetical protein [Deltaproteobacteria bacterium]